MYTFGVTNATLTKIYGDSNHDIYGEPSLGSYTVATSRAFFCRNSEQHRSYTGDLYKHDATFCGNYLSGIKEGVIIEITPDNGDSAKLWLIEYFSLGEALPSISGQIRMMELGLSEYSEGE